MITTATLPPPRQDTQPSKMCQSVSPCQVLQATARVRPTLTTDTSLLNRLARELLPMLIGSTILPTTVVLSQVYAAQEHTMDIGNGHRIRLAIHQPRRSIGSLSVNRSTGRLRQIASTIRGVNRTIARGRKQTWSHLSQPDVNGKCCRSASLVLKDVMLSSSSRLSIVHQAGVRGLDTHLDFDVIRL